MLKCQQITGQLIRDERGGIAIIFGLSAMVLFTLAGIAIDSSRAYNVSFKLQAGLDAAALAAAQHLDDEDATAEMFQTTGEAYFKAYLDRLKISHVTATNFRANVNETEGSVTVTADVTIPTMFGTVASDVGVFDFKPSATVMFRPKKIELALVLDITGSMCNVPPARGSDACSSGAKIDALKSAARDIVDTLAATNPSANSIKISVIPYSASVKVGPRAGLLTLGRSSDGCLVERSSSAAYDDTGPLLGGLFPIATSAVYPAYSCPEAEILPLTDIADVAKRNAVTTRIDELKGHGGTAGHIGLAWGWYSISPEWSRYWPGNSSPRPKDPDKTIKAVVFMTDGMFNTSYFNGGEDHSWPNPSSADATQVGTSGYQALKLCEEMRSADKGITIYTVGFQTPPEAEALLKQCSGEDTFYNADNASQLSTAFKEIAKRLTSMRVSS